MTKKPASTDSRDDKDADAAVAKFEKATEVGDQFFFTTVGPLGLSTQIKNLSGQSLMSASAITKVMWSSSEI